VTSITAVSRAAAADGLGYKPFWSLGQAWGQRGRGL